MGKRFLKVIIFIVIISISLYCERKNSRNDVISKASEEYLSKVDGTKPGELDSLLISGVASYGDGNKALAIRYFEKAYELGDVRGAVKLYELYNTEKDMEKIKEWEIKAAEMGDAGVQYNLAVGLANTGKLEEAEKWYLKAAEQGYGNAQKNLGVIYYNNKNYEKAKNWYLKSAEQGDSDSQNNLGVLYEELGDYKEAEKWLLESSKKNNVYSYKNLGELYEKFIDNKGKALYWYKKAAEAGDIESKKKLKELREE